MIYNYYKSHCDNGVNAIMRFSIADDGEGSYFLFISLLLPSVSFLPNLSFKTINVYSRIVIYYSVRSLAFLYNHRPKILFEKALSLFSWYMKANDTL